MSDTDLELLSRYARHRSEDAFTEIVRRHLGLVYSAALRQVRTPQLAEEVAQSVFVSLSREAGQLRSDTILAAWLYQVAHHTAANVVRGEVRRQMREQIASEMNDINATALDWTHIKPLLDEAMHALDETDRAAVLLRYFENQSLREVGQTLGASENAIQKRLGRAIERLRKFFAKRGVNVGTSGLVVVISANAVQAAPIGLAVTISTAAALSGTVLTTATATTTKAIFMTSAQKTWAALGIIAFLSFATYEVYRARTARSESIGAVTMSEMVISPQLADDLQKSEDTRIRSDRERPAATADLDKLKADLHAAIYNVPRSNRGTRAYPPEGVRRALLAFGSSRKEAWAVVMDAFLNPELEIRMRAVSTLGLLGRRSNPKAAQYGILGEPAPEAKGLCWRILMDGDKDLASLALSSLRSIGLEPREIPALTGLLVQTGDPLLRRYLPETIAETIASGPVEATPSITDLERLLDHADPGIKFGAACALAQHEATGNPKILATLIGGLKSTDTLHQLMALETLQRMKSAAEPALQAILDFGDTTTEESMKTVAFSTLGKLRGDLRSQFEEVEQVLSHEERIADWNQRVASGSYTQQDLLEALKEPMTSLTAAAKLGEMGSQARDAVPAMIAAMGGQDQSVKEGIIEAIHHIDPRAAIPTVPFKTVASALIAATLAAETGPVQNQTAPLIALLEKSRMGNSEWQTQQEVVELAAAIAKHNAEVYGVFAAKLIAEDPSLAPLISKLVTK